MPATKTLRLVMLPFAAAGLAATVWVWTQGPARVADTGWATAAPEIQGVMWPVAHPVAPFDMRTHRGDAFDASSLRGQWNFVFFGFLQCPDVCPTTLTSLHGFRRALLAADPAAHGHRFVFVSVDPERDSAERLAPYLEYFDPAFLGLVGSEDELAGLARSMAVRYAKTLDEDGRISFEHTTSVMVVDPQGRVVAALPSPHDPPSMTRRFLALQRHFGG
jgi:protein SCO1